MSPKRKSNSSKWIVTSIIVVLVLLIVGRFAMRQGRAQYESVVANVGDITTYYSFSGNVDTKNRQTVMADKIMQISDIKVKEGDTVKEGDVLLTTTTGEEIKSKINGEVANIGAEVNVPVMAGTKLMEIVDYNDLQVNVKVDEYDISAVKVGKTATVNIGAINKDIKGKISSMSNEGQVVNGVTYFIATIDLAKDKDVKIGMSAEVKLLSAKATGVVTLPMTAIQFDENNKPYVFVQSGKGKPIQTEITTGINDGTTVEVKSGVTGGETILYTKPAATTNGIGFKGPRRINSSGGGNNDGNS